MEFWNNEIICGYPVARIKKLLRLGLAHFITVPSAAALLKIGQAATSDLLQSLQRLGYLTTQMENDDFWQLGARGSRLAHAEVKRTLSPDTVNFLRVQLEERIQQVNAQERFLCRIGKFWFGTECVTATSTIRYFLIGVELLRKENDHEKYLDLSQERVLQSGRVFSNFIQRLDFPFVEVEEFLRAGLYGVRVLRMPRKDVTDGQPLTIFQRP